MTSEGIVENLTRCNFLVEENWLVDDRISEYLRDDWFETYPL